MGACVCVCFGWCVCVFVLGGRWCGVCGCGVFVCVSKCYCVYVCVRYECVSVIVCMLVLCIYVVCVRVCMHAFVMNICGVCGCVCVCVCVSVWYVLAFKGQVCLNYIFLFWLALKNI